MCIRDRFRTELIDKIVGFNAHAVVKPYDKPLASLSDKDFAKGVLSNDGEAVIFHKNGTKGVLLKGYLEKDFKELEITNNETFFGSKNLSENTISIEKDNAILTKVSESYAKGQPILIFTASVNKSEHYSKLLREKNIPHTILNAKNHEKEAEIIANAGKKNSVIVTTSISGRGVDIQLGGKKGIINENELKIQKEKIKSLGGLFVIGTERMESRRVDNQARGRSGRQGDEGNSIFYVSLEDDLMRLFGSESMNKILEKLGLKDGESIDHPWINKALELSLIHI